MRNKDRKRRAMEGVYAAPEFLAGRNNIPSGSYPRIHAQPDSPVREMEDVYGCPKPGEPCDLDDQKGSCPSCGHANNRSNNFCVRCGCPLKSPAPLPSPMMCVYAAPQVMCGRNDRGGMGIGKIYKK